MKVCQQCQAVFPDDMNYCLDDGLTLVKFENHDPEQTLSFAHDPTLNLPYPNQTDPGEYAATGKQRLARPTSAYAPEPSSFPLTRFLGVLMGLFLLTVSGSVAGYFYWRSPPPGGKILNPPPEERRTSPPPKNNEEKVKFEILEPTTDEFGFKYLKCRITNTSEEVVEMPYVDLTFYKGDVKIKNTSAHSDLDYLKPGQSVAVWVNLWGTDNYTSVKAEEPVMAKVAKKKIEEIYPTLSFNETGMRGEMGNLIFNGTRLRKTFYKVGGIVENNDYDKIDPEIFVIFYDENSEMVGMESTRVSNLKRGEKAKFEVSEVETDLHGKPERFEIIAISDR
ncbi:MAG: FxLYD domain-containing protein [Pyrinomonadaceae bacterium]